MKIILIIPARLNSNRLKNKVTLPILSLPMIEHVRRRAKLLNYGEQESLLGNYYM